MENLNNQEYESTLVILAVNPGRVINSLAELTSISDYRLIHKNPKAIKDIYLDTLDNNLGTKKLSLRLRESNGEYGFTIKGPAQINKWGAMERFELELPWSMNSIQRIFAELAKYEIFLKLPVNITENIHPLVVLLNSDLKVIQYRENYRQIRIASLNEEDDLAEVAIDSVIYHFSERYIRHYEVEIEVKGAEFAEVLNSLIDSFVKIYKPQLRLWYYGKLTTGSIIEKLLKKGSLEKLIGPDSSLKPATYRLIEYYIKSNVEF
jgi:inorganic triphosphatase YgiF